jgi:hypothetical protein
LSPDADGYGYDPGDRGIARLLADLRTLSPAGIERTAWGWDHHETGEAHNKLRAAEKAALRAIETSNQAQGWEELRRQVLDLTEGRASLVSWKAEHGDIGHKAEEAALAAALGLYAADRIDEPQRRALVRAASEALPWLLPDTPPAPQYREDLGD